MNSYFILLLFLCGTIVAFDPLSYTNSLLLRPEYRLHWRLNGNTIYLALEVNTTGWVGFGIGEPTSGSMHGSDMVTGSVVNGVASIKDRYATEKALPPLDSIQNWALVSGEEANGKTIIEVSRALSTGDTKEDRPIVAGKTRIVFAHGDSDIFAYHGSNRGSNQIEFIPDPNPIPPPSETDLQTVTYTMNNYAVPAQETTYVCRSFPVPQGTFQIVKWSALVQPENAPYLHHFVIYGCLFDEWSWSLYEQSIHSMQFCDLCMGTDTFFCRDTKAPGMDDIFLPPNIGIPFGNATSSFNYITLEVHYNNPSRVSGIVDSSGVIVTYTGQLRPINAGVITAGDTAISAPDIPAGQSCTEYEFSCSSTCTKRLSQPLHIIGSFQHMHQAGRSIWTTHWRGDQNLGFVNRIEFWDFGFQHQVHVNVTLQPGDRLNTHCAYDTSDRTTPTKFGHSSLEEMCFDFLLYWPFDPSFTVCGYGQYLGTGLSVCTNAEILEQNPTVMDPEGGATRTFGDTTPPECSALNAESNSMMITLSFILLIISFCFAL